MITSRSCWTCNRTADGRIKLSQCSQCKLVMYCGRKCQRRHWKKAHKNQCKGVALLRLQRPDDYQSLLEYFQFVEHIANDTSRSNHLFPFVDVIHEYSTHFVSLDPIADKAIRFPTSNPWIMSPSNDLYALCGRLEDLPTREQFEDEYSTSMTYAQMIAHQKRWREGAGQQIDSLFSPEKMFLLYNDGLWDHCETAAWIKLKANSLDEDEPRQSGGSHKAGLGPNDLASRLKYVVMNEDGVIFGAMNHWVEFYEPPLYASGKPIDDQFRKIVKLWRQQNDILIFCVEPSLKQWVLYKIERESPAGVGDSFSMVPLICVKREDAERLGISESMDDAWLGLHEAYWVDGDLFFMYDDKQFMVHPEKEMFTSIAYPDYIAENKQMLGVLDVFYFTKRNTWLWLVQNNIARKIELWILCMDTDGAEAMKAVVLRRIPVNYRLFAFGDQHDCCRFVATGHDKHFILEELR